MEILVLSEFSGKIFRLLGVSGKFLDCWEFPENF
jgi:hypothetical protein